VDRAALDACIAAPETQARLDQDVDYAMRFKPEGTPIVLANGRVTIPSLWFLYGLAAASGNPDAPWLKALPPPQPYR
jgi:protein-disulfide isomerase